MVDPEREIKDMSELMDALAGTSTSLDGIVLSDFVDTIEAVITEWNDHTVGCIQEMAALIED